MAEPEISPMAGTRTRDSPMARTRTRNHQGSKDTRQLRPHSTAALPPRLRSPSQQGISQHNAAPTTARHRISTRHLAAASPPRQRSPSQQDISQHNAAPTTARHRISTGHPTAQRHRRANTPRSGNATRPSTTKGAARKTVQRLCKHHTGEKNHVETTYPRGRCGR